ncbi:hypothetical protein TR2A62_2980 [Thalassobium sp. R2A62]|nr:hypothetical protein TR2A62_2980 [Thalassobium sp. R2A62]
MAWVESSVWRQYRYSPLQSQRNFYSYSALQKTENVAPEF